MKNILLTFGFSFAVFVSSSLIANAEEATNTKCQEYEHLAKVGMTSRQFNVPLEKILKGTRGEDYIEIVKRAYEQPIVEDPKGKTEAIDKYTKEIAEECKKNLQ